MQRYRGYVLNASFWSGLNRNAEKVRIARISGKWIKIVAIEHNLGGYI